jgi:RNA polymerase sigma-70 factor (ECF subfamily)
VPKVIGRADSEAAAMASRYDEHAAVLWRSAIGLTGDASRAEDVVRETLLRAWQHPEFAGDAERSARASLFPIARNMIVDERRSAPFRDVASSFDDSSTPHLSAPDELDAALDRMVIADAMAQLSAEYRAVIERSCYRGWTTAQMATDLGIAEETVEVPITLCRSSTPAHAARNRGAMLTALRPIRTPIGSEYQMVQGDWVETKATPQPVRAAVDLECLMVAGDGGR